MNGGALGGGEKEAREGEKLLAPLGDSDDASPSTAFCQDPQHMGVGGEEELWL